MKKSSPTVLLGITGGIAAIKIPELITALKREGVNIIPVMTHSATRILEPDQIEQAAGRKPLIQLFEPDFDTSTVLQQRQVEHISLADQTDLIVIAPATAHVIAKLAQGLADDLLTTTVLAAHCPVLLFPSMNTHMWRNPVVKENVELLRQRGFIIVEPDSGMLACGYEGEGRLPTVQSMKAETLRLLNRQLLLKNTTVIVTAGGTREFIDEVRVITNRSSGKMGVALADAYHELGAEVILLRATTSVKPRYLYEEHTYETANDLEAWLKKLLPRCQLCIHAAAVSDFTIKSMKGKIKSDRPVTLHLIPRSKLYEQFKTWNPKASVITFKAESKPTLRSLHAKIDPLLKSGLVDAVIANDISGREKGFESNENAVTVFSLNKKPLSLPQAPKTQLARDLARYVSKLFESSK